MALTGKQEAFCKEVALNNQSLTAAYVASYDTSKMVPASIHDAASKLGASPAVAQRIQVLRERATAVAVKKAGYTLAEEIETANDLIEQGKAAGQVSAAVAAAKHRAQLGGHLAEKKENNKSALDEMDVEKLLALKAELEAKLQRNRDALELAGDVAPAAEPMPMRRVIG